MADALIISFIKSEQDAILGRLNGQSLVRLDENFYEATLQAIQTDNHSVQSKIVVALPPTTGRLNAALFAAEAIKRYSPRYIFVVGVCGALQTTAELGDVVVASEVIDYEIQKITDNRVENRWQSITTSSRLLALAKSMERVAWTESILIHRPGKGLPKIIIGPIASGDKIIASDQYSKHLRNYRRDLVAVEMESVGVIKAVQSADPKIEVLVIRAVADRASGNKNDIGWLEYASDVAATFTIQFFKHVFIRSYNDSLKPHLKDSTTENEPQDLNKKTIAEEYIYAGKKPHLKDSTTENEPQDLNKKTIAEEYIYAGKKHFHFYNDPNLQQKCLGIRDYAKAIAHVLDHATGEVCISIMGHWGRGKTFLMKTAEEELTSPELEHKYRTVWFSAWKYRTVPEVWVHLYQTFAEASAFDGLLRRLPRTVRSNMLRVGTWPIYMALASMTILMFPLISEIRIAFGAFSYLLSFLGIMGLVKVALVSPGVIRTARKLSKKYIHPTSHEEKLGLQASIGKDLKYLISGWLGKVNLSSWHFLGYGALVLATAFSTYWAFSGEQIFINGNIPLRPSSTTLSVIILLWLIAAGIAPIWTLLVGKKENRLLLIVDDLDRCPSNQILDIIESIKLLLEDKALSEHVQVVILIEFEMLKQAILSKYKIDNPEYTPERIIEDNMQKLFLASLTLPQLTTDEIAEIANACIVTTNIRSTDDDKYQPVTIDKIQQDKTTLNPDKTNPSFSPSDDQATRTENLSSKHRLSPSTNLDSIEQEALIQAINDKATWGLGRSVTPRAIQSVLLRYQFARYLLMLQNVPFDPYELARLITKGNNQTKNDISNPAISDVILSIVRRVSI